MARNRPTTDTGTVILHWVLAGAWIVLVATGLRMATDDPETEWLIALDPILPSANLWFNHLAAGVVLIAILAGYTIYVVRARLTPRIRLDRSRVLAMASRGRARWSAVNVVVFWLLIASLVTLVVTGVMLFGGAGRTTMVIHREATWVTVAAFVAHVALHAAYGGIAQLTRILRPSRLVIAAPPPDLAELLAQELAKNLLQNQLQSEAEDQPRSSPLPARDAGHSEGGTRRVATLRAHPLAVGLATAFVVGSLAVGTEQATRATLRVAEIDAGEAPRLDGDMSDPVWAKAAPASVLTSQGGDFGGSYETRVEVRAVHDGVHAYFAFVWDDPTRSLKHMPLVKRDGRWYVAASRSDLSDELRFNEDKLAILLARPGLQLIGSAIHLARQPLPDKPPSATGRGLHYTRGGGIADVWQWRASHGGPSGYIENSHFGEPRAVVEATAELSAPYAGGYQIDPGQSGHETNITEVREESGRVLLRPKRLPRDPKAVAAAVGRVSDAPGESESEGARWWMTPSETTPYSRALDDKIPDGTVIPSILVPDTLPTTATSVRGVARWAAGRWTLEVVRRLYTGSPHDVAIKTGVLMWVAAFDHAEKRHTRHLRPFRLEVD